MLDIETGIMIPDQGYVQVSGNEVDLSFFPEGTIVIPVKPTIAHVWVDGEWLLDIDKEREFLEAQTRAERNRLLSLEVDVIAGNVLRWGSLPEAEKVEWANYRTALLDVPQQAGFPADITWPTKP